MNILLRAMRWFCIAALGAVPVTVAAQAYPAKPVRIVVPFGPGGVADITARVLAQKMTESMGQQVLVENKPSAGGILASETVARADPDGYTLLFITNGNAVSESLFKSLRYNSVKDFAPISTVGYFDLVFLASPDSDIRTVGDLISRARAAPGKLNIGTINPGSTQNLAAELFKSMANIEIQVVPYKRTPDVVTAARGGDVQAAVEILAPVLTQISAGALRAIAVAASRRSALLPQVPTVAESGVAGYEASSWNGLAAPVKTPEAIVTRLNREVNAAIASPDVRKRLQDVGIDPRAGTPRDLHEQLVADIAKWKAVIEKAGIPRQ